MARFTFTRRTACVALAAAATFAALPAAAQNGFPNKPIRIVVGFAPGGPTDMIARAVGQKMSASLKTNVIVENKPGAGGNIAAGDVARADADGYTVLFGIDTTFTINPALYASMPFAPDALKPLSIIASSGLLVGTHPAVGAKTLADLVAKAKKDAVTFSSAGNGSPGHFAAEIFGDATGGKIIHIPYKGNAPAVLAVLSGEVNAGILATPGMVPHVKAGKITPLAVTSRRRSQVMPDVPTVAEAGVKELEFEVLQVAMLPAATPPAVVEVLSKAISDALQQPDLKNQLAQLDSIIENQSGAAAQQRLDAAKTRYARIVKSTGMKSE
ncbi:Bug family tripartite tricarboxylate transporter substrate binding protein [Piscinibacter sakaiensis]|uniref:Bug family tripartite tricarboxylate transporter substrate binding protein n=1 Tax=Piscinibacter sakaiensis TaxID=1547922 RepID=UPI003AAD43B6